MENAERLVSKAYEWVDQVAHELQWDDAYTSTRKGERGQKKNINIERELPIIM